jgi:bifunctional DNA-binding transcriptional regulator/antitoxin component of YhaV-PrlF toxin-antitoxin module
MYYAPPWIGPMGVLSNTKVSEKNLTTVPKPVRNFLDVGVGDRVEWHVENGDVVVRKATAEE